MRNRLRFSAAVVGTIVMFFGAKAHAEAPAFDGDGKATFYDYAGTGACGSRLNAARDRIAAIPAQYWTAEDPANDPMCFRVVSVSYRDHTVMVLVKDKCGGCAPNQIELSKPVFADLANPGIGVLQNVSWRTAGLF